ncbi:hypothetical protein HU200_017978 [Digitaria exilis]|uniref:Myb/SANT-like domain-containing protein n=1 Tax=Digitaria exilis TaxID=1010633 RepID=A0A835F561_9POAL|nr:hypothetical protein HU200_017978 [Digitaria exilis]
MYKGQNGWTAEGWRSITNKFNEMFPMARFTKQQIQEKEKELKSSYKVVRDAKNNSGTGWNEALGMIIAEPNLWEKLIQDNPKVAKFRKKAFPLFSSLEKLYEGLIGSVATGDLNFTSTENPISSAQRVESTPRRSTSEQSTHNGMAFFGRNPFSSFHDSVEGTEAQSAPLNYNLEDQEGGGGKRRKQSQTAAKLGDYIDFRKSQIQKTVEKLDEKKRHEDEYSVEKCIDIVDGMEDLSDEQKADANELFQTEMNRQIFVKTKNPNIRVIWLKKKISKVCL